MPEKPLSIRFNEKEWEIHEKLKEFFGFKGTFGEDATTIKIAEYGLYNVLHSLFGDKLFDMFRRKYIQEKVLQDKNKP